MSAQERSIGLDPELYTVVWIAPIEIEARAALQALDHYHCGHFKWERGQDYLFHAGDINRHNVVIATLPIGQNPSTAAAASLASTVKIHFPNIQFGFLVGYASGLPNLSLDPPQDIRLGDVIVGIAEEETAGVVAYDWGTETENGFELFDGGFALATTASIVRAAVGMISIWSRADMERVLPFYNEIRDRDADGLFHDPGQAEDNLYAVDQDGVEYIVQRDRRPDNMRSWAWYGPIGSGDKLFRDSEKRDKMRDKYNLLGLEIGAAGIMNTIPVGVIRGVSDYGDQHNDKLWQPYAAAMAAAYTKAILNEICPRSMYYQRDVRLVLLWF